MYLHLEKIHCKGEQGGLSIFVYKNHFNDVKIHYFEVSLYSINTSAVHT